MKHEFKEQIENLKRMTRQIANPRPRRLCWRRSPANFSHFWWREKVSVVRILTQFLATSGEEHTVNLDIKLFLSSVRLSTLPADRRIAG